MSICSPPHAAPDEKSRSLSKATYKDLSRLSAHVSDALLGIHLSRGRWLRRWLQYCCGLIFVQVRQQHGAAIRKFERIVMDGGLVLVNLAKDGRLVVD